MNQLKFIVFNSTSFALFIIYYYNQIKRVRWLECVACMEKKTNAYKFETKTLKGNLSAYENVIEIKLK